MIEKAQPNDRRLMSQPVSVVVYTPANMNAIDGSSVWIQTITLALADVPGVDVTLLLSHGVTTERMIGPLLASPNVTVIDPIAEGLTESDPLTLDESATILSRMTSKGADVVVVRGMDAAHRFSKKRRLRGRLWPYLTDIPQSAEDVDTESRERMTQIMSAAPILLCQTEELRLFVESQFPAVKGKGRVFPPAIPRDISPTVLPPPNSGDLRLCYSGKFARTWNTYEMCELPAALAARGINATLTMVGDKINRDPARPEFVTKMRSKLESSPRVDWVGGVAREQSIAHMAQAHIGLSWRAPELDDSLELSTKLLEYCAAGTPPVLNRTPMHEHIFGIEYPLFVDQHSPVLDLLESVARSPDTYQVALGKTSQITVDYTLDRASQRLSELIAETLNSRDSWTLTRLGWMRRKGLVDRSGHR